jgi:hypothetical protein
MHDDITHSSFAAIDTSELAAVHGGQRLIPNDSAVPWNPWGQLHLPAPSVAGPLSKTKCPSWRVQLGQNNNSLLVDGTIMPLRTMFCERYRSPLPK